MKYIISEEQNDRLKRIMFHVFDSYLTPFGGWKPKHYENEIKQPFGEKELFIDLEDVGTDDYTDYDELDHIFYSACENPNYSYTDDSECPEVRIPKKIYELLNDSFGNIWIPLFIEWFEDNSSLPVNYVDTVE